MALHIRPVHIFPSATMKEQFNGRVASSSRRACTVLPFETFRIRVFGRRHGDIEAECIVKRKIVGI
jgi:hypothetical protein